MNILKLFIPREKKKLLRGEIESWTVTWYIKTGWNDETKEQSKVFMSLDDATEFKNQLREKAKFIGCYIDVRWNKN
jgi:hypothetical protein